MVLKFEIRRLQPGLLNPFLPNNVQLGAGGGQGLMCELVRCLYIGWRPPGVLLMQS